MLQVTIEPIRLFNESDSTFVMSKEYKLTLEHSLISLARWESKWHKPFLTKIAKSEEETIDYIRCMTINKDVDPIAYSFISKKLIGEVNSYIQDPMTATTYTKEPSKGIGETITAELIYFWMINHSVPFECEKWHLNRLLTLINVCSIKTKPKKKMNQRDLMARNRALNEKRRLELNSTG